jgi:hypothetical protein
MASAASTASRSGASPGARSRRRKPARAGAAPRTAWRRASIASPIPIKFRKSRALRRKIDEGAALAILDFDDPDVRIEGDLASQALLDVERIAPFLGVKSGEQPRDALGRLCAAGP